MAIIIEEYNRSQKQKIHHRFNQPSVSIGRGYHNDMIVNDTHVDAMHCRIFLSDNGWMIEDLNSTNGTYINKNTLSLNRAHNNKKLHPLTSGDTLQIGNKTFRFLRPDHPVSPAVKFNLAERFTQFLARPLTLLLFGFMTVLLGLFDIHHSMRESFTWDKFVLPLLTFLFVVWLLPTLYSLFAKLFKGDVRYVAQISASCLWICALTLITKLLSFLEFNVTHAGLLALIADSPDYLVGLLLLMTASFIAFQQPFKKRLMINGGLIALIFIAVEFMGYLKRDDFSSKAYYPPTLKHQNYLFIQAKSTELFLQDSQQAFVHDIEPSSQSINEN